MVNYEVSLYGGYRRVEGYKVYDTSAPAVDPTDADGPVQSLTFFRNDTTFLTELYVTRAVRSFEFVATAGQTQFSWCR